MRSEGRPLGEPTRAELLVRVHSVASVGEGVLVWRLTGEGGFGEGVFREAPFSLEAFTGLVPLAMSANEARIAVVPSDVRGVAVAMV